MKTVIFLALAVLGSISISFTGAEQKESGKKPGDQAPEFSLKSTGERNVSLSDFKGEKGVILIFTCNHCPFSIAYEDRIIALHRKYSSKGYPVVAINPNDAQAYPEDSFENMKIRAKEKNFPFLYLHDESQEIAKQYGAMRTPHVYLLKKKDDGFEVVYTGAIDDNTDNPAEVTKPYVENAVEDLLAGKKPQVNATKAIGCSVKWKKQ